MERTYSLAFSEYRRLQRRARGAQQRDQSEVCGVVVADQARSLKLYFMTNQSERRGSFEIRLADIVRLRREIAGSGRRVVGLFHSHPVSEAQLGPRDLRETPHSWIHLVYDVCGADARLWLVQRHGWSKVAKPVALAIQKSAKGGRIVLNGNKAS